MFTIRTMHETLLNHMMNDLILPVSRAFNGDEQMYGLRDIMACILLDRIGPPSFNMCMINW